MRRTHLTKRTVEQRAKRARAAILSLFGGAYVAHATLALGQPTPEFPAPDSAADSAPASATPDDPAPQPPERAAGQSTTQPVVEDPAPTAPPSNSNTPRREPVATKPQTGKRTDAASADQPMFGSFEGTYGLSGISTGFSFGPAGYYLGAELSVVRQFREFAWLGGYVDGVYDFGREQTRFSIGPEVGWSALGIDGGYLLAVDDGGTHSGVTVRPMLTMGFVSAFGRFSHLFGPRTNWFEAGLLVKYPLEF